MQALQDDAQRRTLIRLSLSLVPFAGIAFLWFIGVVREQLGEIEDRLFSTVFMGSGLLFLAMLFTGAATSASLMAMLAEADVNAASSRTAARPPRASSPSTPCGWRRSSRSR